MEKNKLFINGEWIDSKSMELIEVENPATKEIIGRVAAANEEDVNMAVQGAKKSLKMWKNKKVEDRIEHIEKMLEYFKQNADDISNMVLLELGSAVKVTKPLHVTSYFENIEDFIRLAKDMKFVDNFKNYDVYKEPVGVVACLTPWNFPFGQIVKKVMPALLMGNTVVLKPSQNTPFTAFYFAYAAEHAKLPGGVLQIVTGRGAEVGNILARHKDINMISFTGSTSGGREVSKIAIDGIKRLSLELGGKSASIILEGADYERAVNKTLFEVFPNAGQACSSTTRLLAPKKLKYTIENLVVKHSKKFKYGDPTKKENHFGPLQSKKAYDKVLKYIEIGKKESKLLFEGEWLDENGYFVPPVVFTDVKNDTKIAQEEIFGPVLCIIYYENVEEAIEIVNDTVYGLYGMVFGPEEEALEVAKSIDVGQMVINDGKWTHNAPFGGFKQSGLGREGGIYGLEEYIELKTIFR